MFKGTHWTKMPNKNEIKEKIRKSKLGTKQSEKNKEKKK